MPDLLFTIIWVIFLITTFIYIHYYQCSNAHGCFSTHWYSILCLSHLQELLYPGQGGSGVSAGNTIIHPWWDASTSCSTTPAISQPVQLLGGRGWRGDWENPTKNLRTESGTIETHPDTQYSETHCCYLLLDKPFEYYITKQPESTKLQICEVIFCKKYTKDLTVGFSGY